MNPGCLLFLLLWSCGFHCSQTTQQPNTVNAQGSSSSTKSKFNVAEWIFWKEYFQKNYRTRAREEARIRDWKRNLIMVKEHNGNFARGKELYMVEMNKFADSAPTTLRGVLLEEVPAREFYEGLQTVKLPNRPVPDSINWSSYPCFANIFATRAFYPNGWAFSAAKAIEAQIIKQKGTMVTVSRQELVDCVPKHYFRPRVSTDAFWYVLTNGIAFHSQYPLNNTSPGGSCKRSVNHLYEKIGGFQLLEPDDEENLKLAVALLGPLSVSIRVTNKFFFYQSGVFYDSFCRSSRRFVNHAVVLMGYGIDPAGGGYWIVQNSWGYQWGEYGYARMARNTSANCGIASAAIYPMT